MAKRNQEEHRIQAGIISSVKHIPECEWLHAIPNGGARDVITGKRLKDEGVKPGVWDLFLPVRSRGFNGLYIEVKRPKTPSHPAGRLSKDQKRFRTFVESQGFHCTVAYSIKECVDSILDYLGICLMKFLGLV
jgi:hypothetical protein